MFFLALVCHLWTTQSVSWLPQASESCDEEKTCKLPDGSIITVGSKHLRCPEVLFQPNFIGKEASRSHDTTFQSIMKIDADICKNLYSNILLSGGPPGSLALASTRPRYSQLSHHPP